VKKILAAMVIFGLGMAASAAMAETATSEKAAVPLTKKERTLAKLEKSINAVKTMQAKIVQTTNRDEDVFGSLLVAKPNKMLLNYENSDTVLMADGYNIIFYEPSLDQVSYIGLEDSPAFLVLSQDFSFADERLDMLDYWDEGSEVHITLAMKKDPLAGRISLVFDKKSGELKGWTLKDAKNNRTRIMLVEPKYNIAIDDSLFEFKKKEQ